MTEDEFAALPVPDALRLVFRQLPGLSRPPKDSRPPQYDAKMNRKNRQFCWMSEMNLDGLEYWFKRNTEGAAKGGDYAESNAKAAKKLSYWVEWRKSNPTERWRGIRGNDTVVAAAPSDSPDLYDHTARSSVDDGYDSPSPAAAPAAGIPDDDILF